ncbi:MAG: aryl-sulfate sulfotransferase [Lachnospirales bacterium]
MKKFITLLFTITIILVPLASCGGNGENENNSGSESDNVIQTQEDFSGDIETSIFDFETFATLNTVESIVAYDGSISEEIHENTPSENMDYLVIDLSLALTNADGNGLDLSNLQLSLDGKTYARLDDDFLSNHNYEVLPTSTVYSGTYQGNIAFEIPTNSELSEATLVCGGASKNLNELATKGATLDFLGESNIPEYKTTIESQKVIDSNISEQFENGEYTFENPLIIPNPYGDTPLTALIMFETEEESEITLFIEGKDEYTNVEYTFEGSNTVHQIPVVGLYAEYDNKVTISDNNGNSQTHIIKTQALPDNAPDFVLNSSEPSKMEAGMTFLSVNTYGTTIVDPNGEVRWYYNNSTADSPFHRLENGNMIIASDLYEYPERGRLLEIDLLGKVHNSYNANATIHHDSEENTNGNFLVSIDNGYKEIDRETGDIVHTFTTGEILPVEMQEYYNNNLPANNSENDWIHFNTNSPDGDYVYISPRNQDIIIKMEQYSNEIQWILGEPENIPAELKQYWLEPLGDFDFHMGQHAPERIADLDDNPDTVDIMVFNNNYYHVRGNEDISEQFSSSMHYRVNEKDMTVELVWEFGEELGADYHSEWHGDADYLENANTSLITFSGGATNQPRNHTSIIEVTKDDDKEVVFDLDVKDDNRNIYTYRSERLSLYPDTWEVDVFNNQSKALNESENSEFLKTVDVDVSNMGESPVKISKIGISEDGYLYVRGVDNTVDSAIVFDNGESKVYSELTYASANSFETKVDLSSLLNGSYKVGILSNEDEIPSYYSETEYYFEIIDDVTFSEKSQVSVDERMGNSFTQGDYTLANPLITVDPYDVSPLTAIIMFNTEKPSSVTVTVKGIDSSVDISNTFDEVSTTHSIPVLGLYGGTDNQVVVDVTYDDGTTESNTLSIQTEEIGDVLYDVDMETNIDTESNGKLIFFEGNRNFAVDNNGDVRWYFGSDLLAGNMGSPLRLLENGNIAIINEELSSAPYYASGIYEMNYLGKIIKSYEVVHAHHEITELPNGNLLVPSKSPDRDTEEDYIVEIDRVTGEIVKTIDLYEILDIDKIADDVYVKIDNYNQNMAEGLTEEEVMDLAVTAGEHDWFHLNSMSYNDGELVLSGRHQDMVVNIDYETCEVNWILTDPSDKLPESLQAKLLTPVGENFEYQYGQHAIIYENNILTLYDNGNHRSKDVDSVISDADNYSRGVAYQIDDEQMTVQQIWDFGKDEEFQTFTPYIGDIDILGDNHYLINFGGLIYENGQQSSNVLGGFAGLADTLSRVVEVKNGEIITNVVISDDEYSNSFRASKRDIYEKQKEEDTTILNLKSVTNLMDYLEILSNNLDKYSVFISAKNEASSAFHNGYLAGFNSIGLEGTLKDQIRSSYIGIVSEGNVVENCAYELLEESGTLSDGSTYTILSGGFDYGNVSSIIINNKEYSINKIGLNFVIYDNEQHKVVDSVNFNTYEAEKSALR